VWPEVIVQPGETLKEVIGEAKTALLRGGGYGPTAMTALRSTMKKEHRMVFGASYQVSSGSTGVTSAIIENAMLSALTEFQNVSTLFTEFFVNKFEVVYQPQSRYSKRFGSTGSGADPNDVPLVIADLQHGQAVYASHTAACSAANLLITNTSDNWKFTWKNTESRKAGVVVSPGAATTALTQGWCLTSLSSSAQYTGALQILSPPALPNPTINFLYGTLVARWDVALRCRS
jgi:hypothetical protein